MSELEEKKNGMEEKTDSLEEQMDELGEIMNVPEKGNEKQRASKNEYEGQKARRTSTIKIVILGILIVALMVSILFMGMAIGMKRYEKQVVAKWQADQAAVQQQGDLLSVVNDRTTLKLQAMEKLIRENYYLKDMSEQELENGIYEGLVSSLGDDYADYYTPEELKEKNDGNEGIYYGIGAHISIDSETEFPMIAGFLEGSPAKDADLHIGDLIVAVEGESTYGKALSDVAESIHGEEGSLVKLGIVRGEEGFEIEIERKKIDRIIVTSEMLENQIGYINISEFDLVTESQFEKCYTELQDQHMKGLIIDMRGNPGGVLQTAVAVARQLLPEGMIVYTESKSGERMEYTCDGENEIKIPLAVLVDKHSASAAEILTGAIKDHGVGTIIGTTTYGKGIVQKTYQLSDGSAIKMTTGAYYTPNGVNIHETGIEPDVEVKFDAEAYYNSENPVDNQLEAAKAYLQEKLK